MKRPAIALLAAVAISAPSVMLGQRPSLPSVPQSLSLQEAVEMAVRYNPSHRQRANDRSPAAWGVRNAYASFLPYVSANGGAGYTGAGSQNFFGSVAFEQPSGTVGSSYSLTLSMQIDGRTIMQPGLARAQLEAADAYIESSEINLESMVRQQYLAVLRAQGQAEAAEVQVTRNEEFQRLAQARYDVGQNTMLDVRQAQVNLGQARVALLRADQLVIVEKLRLFQQMGVPAPDDPTAVTLTDTFPIVEPEWTLSSLLVDAQDANPDLHALRARQSAANANERAAKSDWLPRLSLQAGWSGYASQFTNSEPIVASSVFSAQSSAASNTAACNFQNDMIAGLATPTVSPLNCSAFAFPPTDSTALVQSVRDANSVFPFDFTRQPFSARLSVSLPLFTQFTRPMATAQASAAADDAREFVRARELDVRTAVTQAYYGMRAAHEAIDIQEQNQTAAAEALRLATERYRVGSGTFFELLDQQLASQNAERDYINAIYAYHQTIATLESAVGRPLR
jgi:outer membrane protein TolC